MLLLLFFIIQWYKCGAAYAQPTSGKFIKEHKLSGASSVKAALKVLEDKELVYRTNEGYIIYDRFMDLWLKRI